MTAAEFAQAHDPQCRWVHCPVRIERLKGWEAATVAAAEGLATEHARRLEAEKALRFYAEREHWVSRSGKVGIGLVDVQDREARGDHPFPWAGGKTARAYFAKWGEK